MVILELTRLIRNEGSRAVWVVGNNLLSCRLAFFSAIAVDKLDKCQHYVLHVQAKI